MTATLHEKVARAIFAATCGSGVYDEWEWRTEAERYLRIAATATAAVLEHALSEASLVHAAQVGHIENFIGLPKAIRAAIVGSE